ncbi:MAG: hypothetical protein WBW85_03920 [Terriglobales bacterium]
MDPDKTDASPPVPRPFLISFSGIDGAGKTTQIERLSSCLTQQGLRVLRLTFWDHVAVWSKARARVGHRSMDSRVENLTAKSSFVPKNSKHVRKWYLTAVRSVLYLLDVARLHRLLASQLIRNSDVVIFDRYIYDQIANIHSQSFASRTYSKILLRLTPAPGLAFILDALPVAAFARKPEYPLEFLHRNRQTFLHLQELVPQLIIVSDAGAEEVSNEIHIHIGRSRLRERPSPEGKTEVTLENAVVRLQTSCRVQNDPTANI